MKNIDNGNHIKREALLNECKGNIFEFLVVQKLARYSSLEDHFLLELPLEFKEQLQNYESIIRRHGPKLLIDLPLLAHATALYIKEEGKLDQYLFVKWNQIGKTVKGVQNSYWNETDIVGTYKMSDGSFGHLPFSLKLTKNLSFTNTKSAGAKSFIIKYFANFKESALFFQNEFNTLIDESFLMMGHELYSIMGEEFYGDFDSRWSSRFSKLPGELPMEMKKIVHQNYYRLAIKLGEILSALKKIDDSLFFNSLMPLCGFGHPEIVQVNCFHEKYELKKIVLKKFDDFLKNTKMDCYFSPIKEEISSFEISLGDILLQVRIKPMNEFTTTAYKINCSTKVK